MYPISKGAVGGGSRFQAADLLFFPCSALLFSAELPILRVFFAVFQFARPPLQGFTGGLLVGAGGVQSRIRFQIFSKCGATPPPFNFMAPIPKEAVTDE
jgi:hypothetical protein